METTRDSNIDRILDGKYELVRVLGTGGMGRVYEATHLLIKRRLAVKLLHAEYAKEPHFAERFKREAQTTSTIGHEHIVDVTDMGCTERGELFIVMEYLEGKDLASILKDTEKFSPERACHIMVQALSALEVAHAKGIVHRDLKPANIFLMDHHATTDYVKLVDFGISKIHQEDSDMSCHLTKTGELLGTPSFMSPEQARGELNITAKSDIFSAGVILYKLLTGVLPFEDNVLTMLLMKILNENPPHPCEVNPKIPRQLGNAVYKAMAKSPDDRFEDAAAFRRILQCYSPETPAQAGLKVTQYRDTSEPFLYDRNRRSRTPFQLELSDGAPSNHRGKQMAVLIAIVAALIIGGWAVFSTLKRRYQPKPAAIISVVSTPPRNLTLDTPPTDSKNAPPPLLKTISIALSVSPDTALVQVDGHEVGEGSVEYNAPADGKLHDLRVTAQGYSPHLSRIRFDDNRQLLVKLTPLTLADEKQIKPTKHSGKDTATQNGTTSPPPHGNGASPQPSDLTTDNSRTPAHTPRIPAEWDTQNDNSQDGASQKRPSRVIDEVNPW